MVSKSPTVDELRHGMVVRLDRRKEPVETQNATASTGTTQATNGNHGKNGKKPSKKQLMKAHQALMKIIMKKEPVESEGPTFKVWERVKKSAHGHPNIVVDWEHTNDGVVVYLAGCSGFKDMTWKDWPERRGEHPRALGSIPVWFPEGEHDPVSDGRINQIVAAENLFMVRLQQGYWAKQTFLMPNFRVRSPINKVLLYNEESDVGIGSRVDWESYIRIANGLGFAGVPKEQYNDEYLHAPYNSAQEKTQAQAQAKALAEAQVKAEAKTQAEAHAAATAALAAPAGVVSYAQAIKKGL